MHQAMVHTTLSKQVLMVINYQTTISTIIVGDLGTPLIQIGKPDPKNQQRNIRVGKKNLKYVLNRYL